MWDHRVLFFNVPQLTDLNFHDLFLFLYSKHQSRNSFTVMHESLLICNLKLLFLNRDSGVLLLKWILR